ncbi:retrotransposon protein, putative, ty1-copia subclass, partial [Tanacetum coccineum]
DSSQSRGKSRSKSRGGRLKCYICQFEDHLKRNCPKNNHKKSTGYFKKDEQPSSSGSTYDDFELGDNKEFKIRGIGKVRIQLRDGSTFVLHNVRIRRDNCIYSLDGHEVVGGYVFISSSSNIKHLEIQRVEAKVENQTGRKVKKLRTDNGLEFCNRESPSTAIETKTPMDMWSGHPSDHGMLSIFGYVVYPHDKQEVKNHTLEKDQIDQKDGDDEDAGDQETDQTSDLTYYQLAQDRELRTRTKPLRFQDESNMAAYAFVAAEEEDTHEPLTYQEAVACEDGSKWKNAMKEGMDSLRKNKTWELVDHPAGKKLMSYKWLFKIKEGIEGVQNPRFKARMVARGFTQRAGIDCNEVFSLVVRHTSIRVILALTACKDYELEQLDVKTTFLYKNLEEVIYMRQPSGLEQGNKVCLLKKSLYGLKQSPRQGYKRFDEYMLSNGFKRSSYDNCVYYRSYAPDWSNKSLLKKEFDMKELGEAKKILGMEIVKDRSCKIIRVSQSGYVSNILNNFRINNGKSVQMPLGGHFKLSLKDYLVRNCDVERMSKVLYANATRSLMFLMVCTRQDIVYAVSVVSRYLANPGKNHWEAVKWILKYLRGYYKCRFGVWDKSWQPCGRKRFC